MVNYHCYEIGEEVLVRAKVKSITIREANKVSYTLCITMSDDDDGTQTISDFNFNHLISATDLEQLIRSLQDIQSNQQD